MLASPVSTLHVSGATIQHRDMKRMARLHTHVFCELHTCETSLEEPRRMGTIGVACKICFTTLLVWSTALMSSFAMMAIVDELWLGVDLQSACMIRPICFGFWDSCRGDI
ncbi:hypothetical protein FALCPG4_19049 [Fusarium falciforme]